MTETLLSYIKYTRLFLHFVLSNILVSVLKISMTIFGRKIKRGTTHKNKKNVTFM
jgi:hypothetical protein